jgi:hypothetical protein
MTAATIANAAPIHSVRLESGIRTSLHLVKRRPEGGISMTGLHNRIFMNESPYWDVEMEERPQESRTTDVSIIGGRKFTGRWRPPKDMTLVSVVGGREIDLCEAEIDPDGVTINVVGLIGGTHVIVPDGINVEISGFSGLGGRKVDSHAEPGASGARVVRLRVFGVLGGLKVESATHA